MFEYRYSEVAHLRGPLIDLKFLMDGYNSVKISASQMTEQGHLVMFESNDEGDLNELINELQEEGLVIEE